MSTGGSSPAPRRPSTPTCCASGYGFVPSPELLRLAGCAFDDDEALGGPVVRRDAWCRTSVPGIYAAGDGTGVEGSFVAIDEGTTAGLAAALDAGALPVDQAVSQAAQARIRLGRRRALAAATSRMYRVGAGIYELAGGRHRGLPLRGHHVTAPWRR